MVSDSGRGPSATIRIAALLAIGLLIVGPSKLQAQGLPPLKTPAAIYEMNEDGTGWKQVFAPVDFMRVGSLRISPDGSRMCFDGVKAGDPWSAALLLSCRLDGSDFKIHGKGAMPNFSPDMKKLSYCSYDEYSVKILTIDNEMDAALERGWGVQWSPVSSQIAYVVNGGTLIVRDVETGERRALFPEQGGPYQSISYNMAWTHDGREIAIQGRRADGAREIAVVDAQGAEFGFRVITPMKTVSNFLAFHPAGARIAFQSNDTDNKCSQLFTINVKAGAEPVRIPGQPEDRDNVCLAWLEGGRKMRVISWQR